MQTVSIICITVILIFFGTAIVDGQTSHTQQNITESIPNLMTNFTKIFSENKEYQLCFSSLNSEECFPAIDVLYQSSSTVAMKSCKIDTIWKAVDEVKKEGYNLDDVISYNLDGEFCPSSKSINIMVIMSK